MFQGRPLTKYFDFSALCPKSFGNYWESIWSPMQTVHIEALRQLYEHSFSTRVATTQTRFYLGQLTQMWVGGVGWSQTFINHCFYDIFDPFLSKIYGMGGWIDKFGTFSVNLPEFFGQKGVKYATKTVIYKSMLCNPVPGTKEAAC